VFCKDVQRKRIVCEFIETERQNVINLDPRRGMSAKISMKENRTHRLGTGLQRCASRKIVMANFL